jgi:predicted dehydrogenase
VTATVAGTVRVALAGVHGHGRFHLEAIRALAGPLDIELAGLCDTRPLTDDIRALAGPVPLYASLPELLAAVAPHITIIATPIHAHVGMALAAMEAGSHVLLEKPPAPTLAGYSRLAEAAERTGLACQVGFQSLGSPAAAAVRQLIGDGVIGELRGIGAAGCWTRDESYYARARWAGRRWLDGVPVIDGAVTNPFAHAVISALAVAGAWEPEDVTGVETDLYHANDIEADDTSAVRVRTASGIPVTIAVTLCGPRSFEPHVIADGSRGRITLWYTQDEVRVRTGDGEEATRYPRTDLLANLVARVRGTGTELLVPLRRTASFMRVVEAVGTAPEPAAIPASCWRAEETGDSRRRVIDGIDEAVLAAATGQRLFRELGLPWARLPAPGPGPAGRDTAHGSFGINAVAGRLRAGGQRRGAGRAGGEPPRQAA